MPPLPAYLRASPLSPLEQAHDRVLKALVSVINGAAHSWLALPASRSGASRAMTRSRNFHFSEHCRVCAWVVIIELLALLVTFLS